MPHDLIHTRIEGAVATVLIDRAAKRNALDLPMWIALGEALAATSANTDLRAVIIRGAGEELRGGERANSPSDRDELLRRHPETPSG